jgi:rubrerythrin
MQKSLDLYRELRQETTEEKEIKIYDFLIEQENDHYKVIEQLLEHVRRPLEWVESAEFGVRKDIEYFLIKRFF